MLVDHTHHGLPTQQTWLAGETAKAWHGGRKMPKGREVEVTTWRCTACGHLESYAIAGKK